MIISFEIPITSKSGQAIVRGANKTVYRKPTVQDYKNIMRLYVMEKFDNFIPCRKPVVITELTFAFLYLEKHLDKKGNLKEEYQQQIDLFGSVPCVVRPDLDNMEKPLYDSFTGVLWKDDSLLWDKHVRKIYSDRAYIKATIVLYE